MVNYNKNKMVTKIQTKEERTGSSALVEALLNAADTKTLSTNAKEHYEIVKSNLILGNNISLYYGSILELTKSLTPSRVYTK